MEQNRRAFYDTYKSLKGCGQFGLKDLRNLFSTNNPKRTWSDSLQLLALISNLSLGRPSMPTLVDAVVAQQRREKLNSYMFRIVELEDTWNRSEGQMVVEVLHPSRGVFGSFRVVINMPDTELDWRISSILEYNIKVFTIVDTQYQANVDYCATYSIFDNLTTSVSLTEIGTDYLQCLAEQIRMFHGEDQQALYHKFLAYADMLLSDPKNISYDLEVSYSSRGNDEVALRVEIRRKREAGASQRRDDVIVAYDQVLCKGYK